MQQHLIILDDDDDAFVADLVASGRFASVSDALREGLKLLELEDARALHLRDRLMTAYEEVLAGDLAEGTGEEAVRRAFRDACERRG